jgi:hypothetical protein
VRFNNNANAVLVDIRGMMWSFSEGSLYYQVRAYPRDTQIRNIAIVDIIENEKLQSFHETAAFNIGISLKWFSDVNTAKCWLINKTRTLNNSSYRQQ